PNRYIIRYLDLNNLESEMSEREGYYPANYDRRILAVKNMDRNGKIHRSSKYGKAFQYSEVGVDVLSLWLHNSFRKETGTSMAAPKITGKIIKGFKKQESK